MVLPLQISRFFLKVRNKLSNHNPIIPDFFIRLQRYGIQSNFFENLSESAYIRLEKQVKARARKESAFEADNTEKFLEALNKHGRAIDLILSDDMLSHLVKGKKFKAHDFIPFTPANKADLELVRNFFSEYLEADLFNQFSKRMNQGDYKEILVWHSSRNVFSPGFLQKMENLLGSQAELIAESINARIPIYKLKKQIPFAKKKGFFLLMNEYKGVFLDEKIGKILSAFSQNSKYTEGSDFADSILFQMGEYHPENDSLHYGRMATVMVAGGSYKVAFIAGGSIIGGVILIFTLVIYNHESKPPGPFVWPKDEWNARIMEDNYKQIVNLPKGQLSRLRRLHCDSLLQQLANDPIAKAAGITYTEDSLPNWQTGRICSGPSEWSQPLAKTPGQSFMFVNRTPQELLLFTYFFNCYYEKYEGIYPCKTPIAYCSIYVKPWDSLELSSSVLERFYIQTGPSLRHWTGRVPYITEDLGSTYAFCNAREQDSILLSYKLKNMGKDRSTGGRLILEEVPKSFTLHWQGHSYAIFLENQKTYLKPFMPFDIKKKKIGA